jgi:hypothetical protein
MEPTIPSTGQGSTTDNVRPFRPAPQKLGRVLEASLQLNFSSMVNDAPSVKALDKLKDLPNKPVATQALVDFLTTPPAQTQTATVTLEASKTAYHKAEELAALVKGLQYKRADGVASTGASPLPADIDDAQYVTILDDLLQQSESRIRMTKKFIRMLKHA